jgi:two-component system chemotaxis sensor kinase CheA
MNENDEVLKEFLVESLELLDKVERDLVALEKGASKDKLASIFRGIHTIKGTCGFLGFNRLEALTHTGENLLGRLRDGKLEVHPDIVTALLAMTDGARTMTASIAATGAEGDGDYKDLIDTLARLLDGPAPAPAPVVAAPDAAPPTAPAPAPVEAAPAAPAPAAIAPVAATVSAPVAPAAPPPPAPPAAAAASSGEGDGDAGGPGAGKIRVDVGLLEKLMNLVGELVLTRNQMLQFTATLEDPGFLAASQRLNLITTELQEGVMKARMQPIDNVWSKFPRIVRDLAMTCKKKVRVEMEGRDTELDRTIIEAIKDPLTHLIRNAVDHGIEVPARRVENGKSEEGCLFLRAFHEGGQVNIEITDDGAGIDLERVRHKAVERNVATAESVARMTDRELTNLIFMPGFSTAEKVTNVSGRGVGMDVVKTNIEKIGGTVDMSTTAGQGTTVKIKIPLTLAIIPALVVSCGGDRYAIPQVSLLELVRLEGEAAAKGIETIHGAPVYRLRGNLLPLVYLARELQLDAQPHAGEIDIVVLQAGDRSFGLVVDEVNDTEEIVVKPLGKQLKGISAFAGATIMGDGRVALILDVMGLAQHANVIANARGKGRLETAAAAIAAQSDHRQTLLLFRGPDDGRMAIPLSMVSRLEEFPATTLERTGTTSVVQYRGEILTLYHLSQVLVERRRAPRNGAPPPAQPTTGTIQVVVYQSGGRQVGLVVDRILDIIEAEVSLKKEGVRPGVLGSMVLQGRVTEMLDIEGIVRGAGIKTDGGARHDRRASDDHAADASNSAIEGAGVGHEVIAATAEGDAGAEPVNGARSAKTNGKRDRRAHARTP